MIVSIVLNPATLGAIGVTDVESRNGACRVLEASLRNAVLLASSDEEFLVALCNSVSELSTPLGQRLSILTSEVAKAGRQCIAHSLSCDVSEMGASRLIKLGHIYEPDVVVCADGNEMGVVRKHLPGCECCLLRDFENTAAERQRRLWDQAVDLTELSTDECLEIVGRTVKFTREVVLADKMIGRAAADGDRGKVERFMKGAAFVAKAWSQMSPLAKHAKVIVQVVTDSFHYHDLASMRQMISDGLAAQDRDGHVGSLEIMLKRDSNPPVFRDRFLGTGRRAWTVQHGVDDLGGLFTRNTNYRRPTVLGCDCPAYRQILSKILNLPNDA